MEIVAHHPELAHTYLEAVHRSLALLARKHMGEALDITEDHFQARFDSKERVTAFANEISSIAASIGAKEHAYTPEFNVAIGDSEEEAEEKLHEAREERREDEPHSIAGLEKAYKYDPSVPDFDIATLKNVFKNHVQAVGYHKAREKDHAALPPMTTEQRKARSQHMIDKAKASVAATQKVLETHLGKLAKTPEEKQKLVEQLHTEMLMEEGFLPKGTKKSEDEKALPPGEVKFKDQDHLHEHLSTKDFALISPFSVGRSSEENEQHHSSFLQDIAKYPWTKVKGMFDQPETSYMIHGIAPDEAAKLAQKYDQFSHIQSSGGAHDYHSHKEHDYSPAGGMGHKFGEFDNYYSQIDLADGTSPKFQLDIESGNRPKPKTDLGKIQKVEGYDQWDDFEKLLKARPPTTVGEKNEGYVAVKSGGGVVWAHQPHIAEPRDQFMKDAAPLYTAKHFEEPAHRETVEKMFQTIMDDPSRHNIPTQQNPRNPAAMHTPRIRHLELLLHGHAGAEIKPLNDNEIEFSIDRHDRGSVPVRHHWTFHKNFGFNPQKFRESNEVLGKSKLTGSISGDRRKFFEKYRPVEVTRKSIDEAAMNLYNKGYGREKDISADSRNHPQHDRTAKRGSNGVLHKKENAGGVDPRGDLPVHRDLRSGPRTPDTRRGSVHQRDLPDSLDLSKAEEATFDIFKFLGKKR